MCLWGPFATGLGCLYGLVRWKNPEVFRQTLKLLSWGLLKIARLRVEVEGLEHLNATQPCLYFGNHQSALDIGTYGSICPRNCIMVAKKEVFWMPVIGLFFVVSGAVFLDRKKRDKAIAQLGSALDAIQQRGLSVAMFPEGTRNRSGKGMLPLKRGPFHLAIAAQVPIVPIVSAELGEIANFQKKLFRPGVVRMRVLPPVFTKGLTAEDVDQLSDKVRNQMLATVNELSQPGEYLGGR